MGANAKDMQALVSVYVLTCNAALEKHKDQFPYRQILAVCHRMTVDERIGLEVYEEGQPQSRCDYYTLRLRDGRLQLLDRGKIAPHIETKLSDEYLQHVANHSQKYIDDPSNLNVPGLKSQFTIE